MSHPALKLGLKTTTPGTDTQFSFKVLSTL